MIDNQHAVAHPHCHTGSQSLSTAVLGCFQQRNRLFPSAVSEHDVANPQLLAFDFTCFSCQPNTLTVCKTLLPPLSPSKTIDYFCLFTCDGIPITVVPVM